MIRAARTSKAFTLVELLVVVAIIALLIAILLPSLSKAKEVARRTVCMSSLKQMALAMVGYAGANEDWTPDWPGFDDSYDGWFFDASRNLQHLKAGGPVVVGKTIAEGYLPAQSKLVFCPSRVRNARYGPEPRAYGWSYWELGATVEYSYQHRVQRKLSRMTPQKLWDADLGVWDNYYVGSGPASAQSCGAVVDHQEGYYNISRYDGSVGYVYDKDRVLESPFYTNAPGRVLKTMEELSQ